VTCCDYVATLEGEGLERDMTGIDAWSVFRVNRVINNIIVAE
jgi:hypothetical protein